MRVLIACEFSGIVRDAFIARGHDAMSVDLLHTERPGPHKRMDIFKFLKTSVWAQNLDLMIFFWPCTNMAVSGARWFKEKQIEQAADVKAFRRLYDYPTIPRVAGENPIGVLSTKFRKPDQIIQPWMFGHGETKATCIWKRSLPGLVPTNVVDGRHGRVWREPPSPERWKNRSRTMQGIADAMAEQWGGAPAGMKEGDMSETQDTRFCYGAMCTWCGPIQEVSNTSKHPRWKGADIPEEINKHSVPCCPHCGGMLLELPTAKEWWDGVDKYDADGHPGYKAMWQWQRQMGKLHPLCFRDIESLEQTYKNRDRDPRFRLRHG